MTKQQMKLTGVATLVIDDDNYGVGLLNQMMRGLGMDAPRVVSSMAAARTILENHVFDLCICEAELADGHAADLVTWLRRLKGPGRFTPILVLTGYSHLKNIVQVRDAGAHMVMRKPVSPQVLYDRIAWSAKTGRPFVETSGYVGPDRRFKFVGPPEGVGRRDNDLSAEIGDPTEPNMTQFEIDALVKPMKVFAE